ncbi:MAG: (Fe-S)-binding protein [Chloroflexi bacterium]|nr:MAG: (Fe-S)-binding protein [Chloroflexota bacterium]
MSELPLRPNPRYKPVSLFVTCLVDMIHPQTGISVVEILEHLGIEVRFPMAQTCCGQPAFNAGYWDEAREVARQFLQAFADAQVIVTPSGSCASLVRHYYPTLFEDEPEWHERAIWASSITWEFTEYLVDGLGITDLDAALPPTRIALHDACHGLRLMGLKEQARQLLGAIDGVTLVELEEADRCCGFGGLFAVKMPEVSTAMLQRKLANIQQCEADIIATGDCGCMMQMNGGLTRSGQTACVRHVADILAQALKTEEENTPSSANL